MLAFNTSNRYTAMEALEHIWISTNEAEVSSNQENIISSLAELKNFRAEQKLQQATLTFIVSQLADKEEVNELKKAF